MASYFGMVRFIDDALGQILDKLDELGLREQTIVVFCSDHGDFMGEHAMQCKGGVFYDSLTRVPLIVSWPGQVATGSARSEHGQSNRRGADAVALAGNGAAAFNARNAAAHRDRRRTSGRDLFRIRQRGAALHHGRLGKAASTLWPQDPDRHLAVARGSRPLQNGPHPRMEVTSTTPWETATNSTTSSPIRTSWSM